MVNALLNQETGTIDSIKRVCMIFRVRPRIPRWVLTLGTPVSALILAGCSTTETRISGHPEIYQSLSARDQALVSQGQIRDGMSRNAVYLAWGSPDRKIVGNMRGRPTETWVYVHYTTYSYPYPYPMVPVMGSD